MKRPSLDVSGVIAAAEAQAKHARANYDTLAMLAAQPGVFDARLGDKILQVQRQFLDVLETVPPRRQGPVASEASDELLDRAGSLVAPGGAPSPNAPPPPQQHNQPQLGAQDKPSERGEAGVVDEERKT
jgi:hypothetical protein